MLQNCVVYIYRQLPKSRNNWCKTILSLARDLQGRTKSSMQDNFHCYMVDSLWFPLHIEYIPGAQKIQMIKITIPIWENSVSVVSFTDHIFVPAGKMRLLWPTQPRIQAPPLQKKRLFWQERSLGMMLWPNYLGLRISKSM